MILKENATGLGNNILVLDQRNEIEVGKVLTNRVVILEGNSLEGKTTFDTN